MLKRTRICALVLATIIGVGCDSLITGFKTGFAASKPFVASLVTSGAISQEKANLATGDIDEGINDASSCEACLKAITVTGPAKRVKKAYCYYQLAQSLRVILSRHNIGGQERLDQIATIAAGAIEGFEAYYTSVNTGTEVTGPDGGITKTGADGIAGEDADKELDRTMKSVNQQLKELTKGK